MTSNKAVGFTSKLNEKNNELLNTRTKFDVNKKPENTPDEQIRKLEKEINGLIEESANCKVKGKFRRIRRQLQRGT